MRRLFLKLTSFKNIVVLWAMAVVTLIVAKSNGEFSSLALALTGIIGAYLPVNVWQKRTYNDKEKE